MDECEHRNALLERIDTHTTYWHLENGVPTHSEQRVGYRDNFVATCHDCGEEHKGKRSSLPEWVQKLFALRWTEHRSG